MTSNDNRVFYLIVWTRERKLIVAEAQWFDKDDYLLASKEEYDDEDSAYRAAIVLGLRHDVEVDVSDWYPVLT